MGAMQPDATTPSPISRLNPRIVVALVAIAFPTILLMRGEGGPWMLRVITFLETLIYAGWAPCAYLIAGAGYGRLIRRWIPAAGGRWCIELGFGLTLLLTLTHLCGMLGVLSTLSAWVISGLGLVLFLPRLKEQELSSTDRGISLFHLVIVCGMMLALVMACNPPGVLWGSEYGGFDALSYHLQLPREWIEQGRIWPSAHNVYSYLPSYVEAAYAHIGLMMGGGMLEHHARGALSAQLLSALMLIFSTGCIGELARAACSRVLPSADEVLAGRIGIALTLGTPWLLVVGTLAYNEIAVVLLGASALCMALRTDIGVWKRAIVCGVIVGGACSCKPTALFLLAPSVGIVLLACMPKSRWIGVTLVCALVGGLTIAPWLIRNELATGNPVFPQMRGVFGDGHWSEAQHAIYAGAHAFDGSVLDRFAMLIVPDPDGVDHVSRFRGFTNGLWALTPLLGLIGLVCLLLRRATHRAGFVALLAVSFPVIAWALLTHLQSRFLIPLAPMLIVLGALGICGIPNAPAREAIAKIACVGAVMWSVGLALVQNRGNPFVLFDLGPGYSLGMYEMEPRPWTAVVNRIADEGDTVYLLGDATPFYLLGDVRYNTVYDRWLIEDAIEANPDDPARWTLALGEQGIDLVVVSFSEIDRYARSGWLPGSIDPEKLMMWIDTLGQPIEVLRDQSTGAPLRAVFRLEDTAP